MESTLRRTWAEIDLDALAHNYHKLRERIGADVKFELPSAIFLIADGNEFRFARFYIVCEEVPLGTPESPPIVCGLSDTLRECPNVAKTRNGMPATAWKKYVNFASKNLPPSVYSGTFLFSGFLIILLIPQRGLCLLRHFPFFSFSKGWKGTFCLHKCGAWIIVFV